MATNNEDLKHLYENLILIDGSANLVHKKFARDQEGVIQRAKDAGNRHRFIHCMPSWAIYKEIIVLSN